MTGSVRTVRFPVFRGHAFLGGRACARALALEVLDFLSNDAEGLAVLDFAGIRGVSHGFADELLSRLDEVFGSDLGERVVIENATGSVADMLEIVADMHDLHMPRIGT